MEREAEIETQAQFARRLSVHKSTVTRWRQDGRLVMASDGRRVDVAGSLLRVKATEGTAPCNQARREQLSDQRRPADPIADDGATMAVDLGASDPLSVDRLGIESKRAALRKLQAEADRAQMQRDLERGDLVERKEVKKDLTDAVAVILNAAETLPDRLAPLLTGVAEQSTVRAILRDEVEQFLAQVSERLGQVAGQ